jgi:hypothetical protein
MAVSYLVEYRLLILTQRGPAPHLAQSLSLRQKSGQLSLTATVVDIKAVTTTMAKAKRIVREGMILVCAQIGLKGKVGKCLVFTSCILFFISLSD